MKTLPGTEVGRRWSIGTVRQDAMGHKRKWCSNQMRIWEELRRLVRL